MGQRRLALLWNTSKVGMPAGNVSQITDFEFMALRELWGNEQLTRSRYTAVIVYQYSQLVKRHSCVMSWQYMERL